MSGEERRARLARAHLYLVCDAAPGGRELVPFLRAAIAGGVDIVQLRDKQLGDRELIDLACRARELCAQEDVLLIVNDRPQVALAAEADGVHLGQDDMATAQVRELVGPELLIGLSTHRPAEIDAAAGTGATAGSTAVVDYIGVGPVHTTPTKPGRAAVGLELVRYAAAHARLPFFAIGGIDATNIAVVCSAGAARVAVVRAITTAEHPQAAAQTLRRSLEAEIAAA
jgi:thiamine-phosphate pyrophosphorylase